MSDTQTNFNATAYIKDAIVILSFLAGVAGVYIKLSEQVIKLELKVTVLEERTSELKNTNAQLVAKIEELKNINLRNIH